MLDSYIRLSELASVRGKPGKLPVSPATIWRWVREGTFPKPIKLGERLTVWSVREVEAYVSRCTGVTDSVTPQLPNR